jgi:hypothetical protein
MDIELLERSGHAFRLALPEPPSLNEMLGLAMKRTRRTRSGGWMKEAIPGVVYDQAHEAYDTTCLAAIRTQAIRPPRAPWKTWRVESAHFRLHNLRDPIELLAGLKWPIDFLIAQRFVEDDGPKHLIGTPHPTQEIDRARRGITLVITGGSD